MLSPFRHPLECYPAGGVLWDNVTLSTNVGSGATCATDTIGGVDFQRIKLIFGPDGTNSGDVSLTNPYPTRRTATVSTCTNVSASAANATVLASNAARMKAHFYNDSDSACFIKEGATASATSYTRKLPPGGEHTVDVYTGIVDCIWESATGTMRVTETTLT